MDVVWNIYVAVAVVAFSFSILTLLFLLAVGAFDDYLRRKKDRQITRELKELSNQEKTRQYLDRVFKRDQKED